MLAGANYLDLASDPRLVASSEEATRAYGCATGGSRLINGNLDLHESLEADLARFLGTEAALVFSTGYMANLGVLATLAGPEDVIVSDELNHASIIDGCRLSRAATRVFRHNDPEDLARVAGDLEGHRRRLLVLDGVYSMDGDTSRLRDLVPVARSHGMVVILDDTHGIGILGDSGRGTAELEGVDVDVRIGNLGKALGSFGAFVACSETVRRFLVNSARSFIFTCSLAPAAVGAAQAGLRAIREEPWRRTDLLKRASELREGLAEAGFDTGESTTHIVPVILGSNDEAMRVCEAALALGVFAQAIRYPSVPEGTARIRFTPTSAHTPEDISTVLRIFAEIGSS